MIEINYQFPLQWPKGWPQTPANHRTYNNGFKQNMSMEEALTYLEEEVHDLKPDTASLSSDVEHIKNARLRKRTGNESGVCLIIGFGTQRFHIPCDRWYMVEHNLYAIHLALRQYRNIEKWGIGSWQQIMQGYLVQGTHNIQAASIKTPDNIGGTTLASWQSALGLGPTATLEDAHATYRRRAKDHKDDQQALIELNLAMEDARKHFGA